MLKRFIWVIIALIIVFGLIFGYKFYKIHEAIVKYKSLPEPSATITASTAKESNWTPTLEGTGSLFAVNGIDITSEVGGQVTDIFFKSGQMVKKGQLLVQLDDSADQAQLKSLQANANNTEFIYQRSQRLFKDFENHGGLSEADLVTDKMKYKNSQALVEQQEQMVRHKQIKAPFTGKIGIRNVNLGQYVSPGTAPSSGTTSIATLQQLDPLLVRFYLPSKDLASIKVGASIVVNTTNTAHIKITGKITAINSQIDPETRLAYIQATIPNSNHTLLPGMFVEVNVLLPTLHNVIVLPQTAVNYTSYGDSVYLVVPKKDKQGKTVLRAKLQFITLGEKRGNLVVIAKGVKAGDTVVTSGQNKLHPGMKVVVNNSTPID